LDLKGPKSNIGTLNELVYDKDQANKLNDNEEEGEDDGNQLNIVKGAKPTRSVVARDNIKSKQSEGNLPSDAKESMWE